MFYYYCDSKNFFLYLYFKNIILLRKKIEIKKINQNEIIYKIIIGIAIYYKKIKIEDIHFEIYNRDNLYYKLFIVKDFPNKNEIYLDFNYIKNFPLKIYEIFQYINSCSS